jgi:hypothetical protein
MDKKPPILVSILAVVLLVLGSLSNVVGYQSVKSTTVNDSPLFKTRTQRATNQQQQNSITSQYLGMGKGNVLKIFIPSRNNERISLQKALNRLQGMDDATFTQFVKQVLSWLSVQDKYNEVNIPQLIITLRQIKENPKPFEQYILNDNNDSPADWDTINVWFPGCLFFSIIKVFFIISLLFFIVFFSSRLNTCVANYTCQWECEVK